MQHSFQAFLRKGGTGQYVVLRRNGPIYGYRVAPSIKAALPEYSDMRDGFEAELASAIEDNTRMLLNALTPPDTKPWVSASDLRDVTDAKEETLRQWDERFRMILDEYETHPQRIRPMQAIMEERLLRAFAGLINQLRQNDLGIERYVWRTRDDLKVRSSHAEHDDKVFRWDQMPKDGHPGQAHNCRCYAEPIAPNAANDAMLIDYVLGGDGYPLQDLAAHEAGGGHTIKLHVGKSEEFLRRSVSFDQFQIGILSNLRKRHGSFPSIQSTQKLTNSNLSRNARIVNEVATGQRDRAFITSEFSEVTGIEAFRTGPKASAPIILRQTFGVGTVIEYAPDMPNGFIIVTSYPRNE